MGASEGSYALLGAGAAHLVSLHGSGGKLHSYCPHFTMRILAGHGGGGSVMILQVLCAVKSIRRVPQNKRNRWEIHSVAGKASLRVWSEQT